MSLSHAEILKPRYVLGSLDGRTVFNKIDYDDFEWCCSDAIEATQSGKQPLAIWESQYNREPYIRAIVFNGMVFEQR